MRFGQEIQPGVLESCEMSSRYFLYRKAWRFDGPPHKETLLGEDEQKALLKKGGILVRNTYDFDCKRETSFWYVMKDRFEGFEELKNRVRNKIRHAGHAYEYRIVEPSLLLEKGYPIVEETFADYAIKDRTMNETFFKNYLSERSFECWGVFEKTGSEMVGFSCVRRWDDCCEYDMSGMKTRCKHNATYPYYGLFYAMNQYYLQDLRFRYVSDGSRSITEHSNIHDFLIQNFNFRRAYCHLQVHYNWWMRLAVRILYPFRKLIVQPQVKAILNMESMKRKTEN